MLGALSSAADGAPPEVADKPLERQGPLSSTSQARDQCRARARPREVMACGQHTSDPTARSQAKPRSVARTAFGLCHLAAERRARSRELITRHRVSLEAGTRQGGDSVPEPTPHDSGQTTRPFPAWWRAEPRLDVGSSDLSTKNRCEPLLFRRGSRRGCGCVRLCSDSAPA